MALVGIAFIVLMAIGLPVSMGILIASAIGVVSVVGFDAVTLIQQMYFGLSNFSLLAIPLFIIAGSMASRGETAERLVNIFRVFLGKIPGSLGIATIFACAFFAAISGTTFATILAIGTIMYGKQIFSIVLFLVGRPSSLPLYHASPAPRNSVLPRRCGFPL